MHPPACSAVPVGLWCAPESTRCEGKAMQPGLLAWLSKPVVINLLYHVGCDQHDSRGVGGREIICCASVVAWSNFATMGSIYHFVDAHAFV